MQLSEYLKNQKDGGETDDDEIFCVSSEAAG